MSPLSSDTAKMKQVKFETGEFYHIYNRGVDKRLVFSDGYDVMRFFQAMDEFNTEKPIGSMYANQFLDERIKEERKLKKLVRFVAYCLNPNHYHFILQQVERGGISEFMRRLGGGYTWYFNNKQKRSGVLFQGLFRAKHIKTNEYLIHLSAYVNLNFRVHELNNKIQKLVKSSWEEYLTNTGKGFCSKEIILNQFKNDGYKKFAESSLLDMVERKHKLKDLENLFLE